VLPQVKVYFLKNGQLAPLARRIEKELSFEEKIKFSLEELLKGLTPWEIKKGYFSSLPKNLNLQGCIVNGDTVELSFSKELAFYGGGTEMVRHILGQIIFTATESAGIKKVKILIDGKNEEIVLGSEGYIIDKPMTREDVGF
jgi:spore germination protein GerM